MVRSELRRDTLIKNIKRAIARAQSENLPATVKEVYAFGGILRGKEKAHDFDAIFVYDQTTEQKAKWEWFRPCFDITRSTRKKRCWALTKYIKKFTQSFVDTREKTFV